ncbi:hypothetical protein IMSHALPRED_009091 [Imshaugia aleurites]|uniref:Uncharacterized protein n=1 Tax=Imshaugia aleurites TaxID=172621 RepID=A0A8H3G4X6_9LECA|nr:hypothetical protein IMSHALPRED_009091 [Imshaugia aleurites]
MDQPFKEEIVWDPSAQEATRNQSPTSATERRHSSSASTYTQSTNDSNNSAGSRGRRPRPSVVSVSSQLPTLQEKNLHKTKSGDHRSDLSHLSSGETVVSSQKVLTSFNKVATRNVEKEEGRRRQLERFNIENEDQREVYERLKKWADSQYKGTKDWLLAWATSKRTSPPHVEELKSLARHYYPPRSELKCHVCDFGEGRAEHKVVDLGELEEYWQTKPAWVDVRWIHAPLGLGLTHSSVEDIFLHDGPTGREFENAGRSGWPYLELEVLNFRHRDNFQTMRDIYLLLHDKSELQDDLNESTWRADRNASLRTDIAWRSDHLAMEPSFWNLVNSDMPWQLTEGLAMGAMGPRDGLRPIVRHVDKQILSLHPFYSDAQLVRSPFRTFHRSDGFLLSLSPMAGINYLDKNFNRHLSEPLDALFDNDDASAVGHVFQAFADQGTNTWHRKTVEWFLVYLITEVGVTPHNFRQGCNAPSFESAYSLVIQDLKRRRYDQWKPKVTVELVRAYLCGIDELTSIKLILQKKVELFKIMQLDVKKFETQDNRFRKIPDNAEGESSVQRLIWAMNTAKHQHECFERLLIDLKQSMDVLFQLRSIEQNELAIVSDSQNKAILVFTIVTVIFLPLSFFTSYYGMNLNGIVNTSKTETYFWKVCGSVAFLIVLFTALGAFRHRMRTLLRQRNMKAPSAMV